MGFSKKHQIEGGKDLEGKKWVIGRKGIRSPLKSVDIKPKEENEEVENGRSTTPTARDSRIPDDLQCPPAPRKRRPVSSCNLAGAREFFNPPELEAFFVHYFEKAN